MFETETERKDRLLTLLEKLETETKFQPNQNTLKFGFYDRIFNGVGEIQKIGINTIRLKRENGEHLGTLLVNPEIAKVSRIGDHLLATLGRRHDQWHLIQIQMIGSYLKASNGQKQMHLSLAKKLVVPPSGPN